MYICTYLLRTRQDLHTPLAGQQGFWTKESQLNVSRSYVCEYMYPYLSTRVHGIYGTVPCYAMGNSNQARARNAPGLRLYRPFLWQLAEGIPVGGNVAAWVCRACQLVHKPNTLETISLTNTENNSLS